MSKQFFTKHKLYNLKGVEIILKNPTKTSSYVRTVFSSKYLILLKK